MRCHFVKLFSWPNLIAWYCSFSLSALAASPGQLPSEVVSFLNLPGKYLSLHQGEPVQSEHGAECAIRLNSYAEEDGSEIVIETTPQYPYPAVANFIAAKKKVLADGTIVFQLTDSGKRPGGSVCGDTSPLLKYVKTVEIHDQTISVHQTFWCLLDGGRKTDIIQGCTIHEARPE